jgi:hypothetical protein
VQIVKVMGGLGNQMFAYAFALALRNRGRDVRLDTTWYDRNQAHNGWELSRIFNLEIPTCTIEERDRLGDLSPRFAVRLRRKLFGERRGHYKERRPGYDATFLNIEGDAYLDGFWQSPRYHEGIEREIEKAFCFSDDLEPEARQLLLYAEDRCRIGIHVRRGDFLSSEGLYGVCTREYYERAINTVSTEAKHPLVIFFSDDLDWCRENLASGLDAVFVGWNRGRNSWRDMRLMTLCDRLVIANSSFSWWGARLGKPGRMIVAPRNWFGKGLRDNRDIGMPGWIRLDA